MTIHPLTALFEPNSIAVICASDEDAAAERVLANLREGGFRGPLYAVHSDREHVGEVRAFSSVAELPQRVELVVIPRAAIATPALLRQCGEQGVKFAMVLASESGAIAPRGSQRPPGAHSRAHSFGLRVVGPECWGLMRKSSHLNASLSQASSRTGKLALISQSGALCSTILDWAEQRKIGFSTVVAIGSDSDVGLGEVFDYLALDPETRAVLLYMEGMDQPRLFMSGLRALARLKPVIAVKAGRQAPRHVDPSQAAVHGEDRVIDAALRRAGVVRVTTLHQLFSTAELLSRAPRFCGPRLLLVTNASELGVLAADRAGDLGLPLAELSEQTREGLRALLPSEAVTGNPLDLLGDASPERYARALELCLADRGVDGALVMVAPRLKTRSDAVAELIVRRGQTGKPLLACFMGGQQVEAARATLAAGDIPSFESPESAVHAYSQLTARGVQQQLLVQAPYAYTSDEFDLEGARLIIEAALGQGRRALSQIESKAVLRAFRIPVNPSTRARSADEALVAAQQLGFPVAMKIDSPDIARKTEVDGVRLNLTSAAQVRTVYRELVEAVGRRQPAARIDGVVVEPMLARASARELVARVVRDPALGPAIAFGAGGRLAELLGAPSIGLPPLNPRLARDLLARTNAAKLLDVWGGLPAVKQEALVELLLRLSDLVCELPEVRELEINPLVADETQAIALDARIVVGHVPASRRKYEHLAIAPYPRRLVQHLQLADGTPITLRPIRPEDEQLEQDFVRNLSVETRRFRFMHGLARLTPEMLIRFTQLDYDRELALVAVRSGEDGAEQEVGVARFSGDADNRGCEFAIVVADEFQGRGLASHLMRALIGAARERHFTEMYGEVLADNSRMLAWMHRLGFHVGSHPDDATLRMVTLRM